MSVQAHSVLDLNVSSSFPTLCWTACLATRPGFSCTAWLTDRRRTESSRCPDSSAWQARRWETPLLHRMQPRRPPWGLPGEKKKGGSLIPSDRSAEGAGSQNIWSGLPSGHHGPRSLAPCARQQRPLLAVSVAAPRRRRGGGTLGSPVAVDTQISVTSDRQHPVATAPD